MCEYNHKGRLVSRCLSLFGMETLNHQHTHTHTHLVQLLGFVQKRLRQHNLGEKELGWDIGGITFCNVQQRVFSTCVLNILSLYSVEAIRTIVPSPMTRVCRCQGSEKGPRDIKMIRKNGHIGLSPRTAPTS